MFADHRSTGPKSRAIGSTKFARDFGPVLRLRSLPCYSLFASCTAEEDWRHYLPPKTLGVVEVADLPQAEAVLARVVKSRGLKLLEFS